MEDKAIQRAQLIIMLSGALLIFVGIGLVIAQMWIEVTVPAHEFAKRGASFEGAGTKTEVHTTYVGLIVLYLGAFLEIIGYVTGRPWKVTQELQNRSEVCPTPDNTRLDKTFERTR
jgi:hypothetical protein